MLLCYRGVFIIAFVFIVKRLGRTSKNLAHLPLTCSDEWGTSAVYTQQLLIDLYNGIALCSLRATD